eukprot:456539-Rhodomonas_salina.1
MRRKRVTADSKGTRPSDEIREVLQGMQQIITENKIALKFTLNTNETGLFCGQGPKNQWVPDGQKQGGIRATSAYSSMKAQRGCGQAISAYPRGINN